MGRFGALQIDEDETVEHFSAPVVRAFQEKPEGDGAWVNGGFFVLEPAVLDRIAGDQTPFEGAPLESLAADGELRRLPPSRVLAADGCAAGPPCAPGAVGRGRGALGRLESRSGLVVQDVMAERTLTPRPCPVCGSLSHQLLYRQRFARFAAGSIGDGYDVVACGECGMCFASGLPPSDRFAQYYADSSKYDLGAEGGKLSERDVQRYADQAGFVAAHLDDRDTPILDVGTAAGGFLVAFREAGFTQLFGVDPSPDAVRVARDEFDLDVAVGGLSAAESWDRGFGLVSYVAVLEHVLSPREQARAVAHLLRPGGCMFVSVPDAGAFHDHTEAPFQEFSVEHINYFTGRSLANAMAAEGYSLVAQRSIVLAFGSDGQGPALEAIYRLDGTRAAPIPDRDGPRGIREYVARSTAVEGAVIERIAELAASGERIYVWGTGTHTLHLLETSRLGDCRIEAFIDSNRHYAGARLAGRPVIGPATLEAADAPILVSSSVTQTGIAEAARARFGPDVPLILLY